MNSLHALSPNATAEVFTQSVKIVAGPVSLEGDLSLPVRVRGLALFAHGSGSGRLSPRNRYVARVLQDAGIATLLFDLLTPMEEAIDERDAHLRFDIPLLAGRLGWAARWATGQTPLRHLRLGFFGASTGGAAALVAAAELGPAVSAVVSRGGRPDLAGDALPRVTSPTLLIVGGLDDVVIGLNEKALARLRCEARLEIVPGATHLFEEPGTLAQVATLAADWFVRHLAPR